MTTDPGSTGWRFTKVALYSNNTLTTGEVSYSIHTRFSDTLNQVERDFLLLRNCTFQRLNASKQEAVSKATMLVQKQQVILAIPQEAKAGQERSEAQQALVVPRTPLRAKVEAWPYSVEGVLHLAMENNLLQPFIDPYRQFVPMTDVRVTYHPAPMLSLEAGLLMVNRDRIEVVSTDTQVGQEAEARLGNLQVQLADLEISGMRAAELLIASEMLRGGSLVKLQEAAQRLCDMGIMSRKAGQAGATVFRQGDFGDTMYLVESGKLELRRDGQHITFLEPGAIFGEMAILGEGLRVATVQAVEDSLLLAIHEDAVEALVTSFPEALANLERLVLERQRVPIGSPQPPGAHPSSPQPQSGGLSARLASRRPTPTSG